MASNLVTTIIVANLGGASVLGSFSVALSAYVFYISMQRALVSEPATAAPRVNDANRQPILDRGAILVLALSVSAAVPLVVVGIGVAPALIPLAALLPGLALQDHMRFVCVRLGRPLVAILMDLVWLVAGVIALLLAAEVSSTTAMWIWSASGCLSLVLAGPLLWAEIRKPSGSAFRPLRWWLRSCWVVARSTWLDVLLSQLLAQGSLLIIAVVLGAGGAGQYRAAQALFGLCLATTVGWNLHYLAEWRVTSGHGLGTAVLRYTGSILAVGVATLALSPVLVPVLFGEVAIPWPTRIATLGFFVASGVSSSVAVYLRVFAGIYAVPLAWARLSGSLAGLLAVGVLAPLGVAAAVVGATFGLCLFAAVGYARVIRRPAPMERDMGAHTPAEGDFSGFATHWRLVNSRLLVLPYIALRPRNRAGWPTRSTDLLIDGFPRSANTFARVAFQYSNPEASVASHLHSSVAVKRAVSHGVPVLLLIRDPVAAVSSLLVREAGLQADSALRMYLSFYRALMPIGSGLIVGKFDAVVSDYGAVIRRVNRKFGTDFAAYEPTPAASSEVFRLIDESEREFAGGVVASNAVARPTPARSAPAQAATSALLHPRLSTLVLECRAVHADIVESSSSNV
jgi:hypothetical protein